MAERDLLIGSHTTEQLMFIDHPPIWILGVLGFLGPQWLSCQFHPFAHPLSDSSIIPLLHWVHGPRVIIAVPWGLVILSVHEPPRGFVWLRHRSMTALYRCDDRGHILLQGTSWAFNSASRTTDEIVKYPQCNESYPLWQCVLFFIHCLLDYGQDATEAFVVTAAPIVYHKNIHLFSHCAVAQKCISCYCREARDQMHFFAD
jgi:hypothetical protein